MSTTDADIYEGSLHREAERGDTTINFPVPGGHADEICVIPKHLPFANYRGKNGAKDIADEKRLGSYDFYKSGAAEAGVVAPLPKRTSTSAAVDLYELPAGTSRPQDLTASYGTNLEKTGKCVAKFKQTDNKFTTTSSAAILGYYHVSRALGDICEIKPAVLRTMDIGQHKKVVQLASEMGVHGTIAKSWSLFGSYYADPKGSGVARDLFTSDFTQIYGALLENTTGEDSYTEWLNSGSDLSSTRAFQHMADSRSAADILGSNAFTAANVQTLVAMRDMSEMILLDYLLAQSDRLTGGNISDYSFAYYLDGGKVKSVKASKASEIPAGAAQVTVKKLTIKDTDAGLLNTNLFEQKGYVSRIHHLHPGTYAALQTFAQKWNEDPAVKQFFHRECTFTNSQVARLEKYLLNAAATLRSRKEDGSLRLDLDLDDYVRGAVATPTHPTSPPPANPQPANPAPNDSVPSVPASPAASITASVGRWDKGATNQEADIRTVQRLLTAAALKAHAPQFDPHGVDGKIARPPAKSNTIAAIESFQSSASLPVDGLIIPTSPAWSALLEAADEMPAKSST